ncbi:NAD(P)-dependent alcohol dehydrogenase [Pseudoflavitalea sp. G-6-1-2]|uniref:NADPH-dependent aldehyde reductase Ahr n=1 Tax=Pseudoflavitalea sp. G-6-1-2 TaxID=2728841 RepID=UPI00146C148D|nr:NAD(P)-dependent alcohol dehydrogenase [Pseudoflavitalea sp. G-6-1-2]NML21117.1 NAD(P)-dependent alcohol dehydrogenase [Pseudoflavitalea sp. G-6-1-2]
MTTVNAYAVKAAGGKLESFTYTLPEIGREQVDIKVHYCGLCYSDINMIDNSWGFSQYPLVPGHEIVGEIIRTGDDAHGLKVGDKVGMGWFSKSCMHCPHCMQGDHQLCTDIEQTEVGRHGGFADVVRGHWSWVVKLPEGIDMAKAGPLFCGGSTVFTPIVSENIRPTDKVGVIGIGGLGHLAIRFLRHWGCEVIAFSSNKSKEAEILQMGATRVIDSTSDEALQSIKGQLNFILNTANVPLNWNSYLECLAPKGKFHTVGIVEEPMQIAGWNLINGGKSVAGSPGAGPALTCTMLEFCVRHNIYPTVQEFPMEKVNEAITHLKEGKARYRVVLTNI